MACTEQIRKLQRKEDKNSQVLLSNTNNLRNCVVIFNS